MSGALSGTLGIYKVNGLDHKCYNAEEIASALIYTMLAILVVVVIGTVVYSNQRKPATEAEGAKEIAAALPSLSQLKDPRLDPHQRAWRSSLPRQSLTNRNAQRLRTPL